MKSNTRILIIDSDVLIELYKAGLIKYLPMIAQQIIIPRSVLKEISVKPKSRNIKKKFRFLTRCEVGDEFNMLFLTEFIFMKKRDKKKQAHKQVYQIKGEAEMIVQLEHYIKKKEGVYACTRDKKAIQYCKKNNLPLLEYAELIKRIQFLSAEQ